MSVPNTTTFNLRDVTNEIYGDTSAGRNLRQCFTDASGMFDNRYVGSKNTLKNFQNYQHLSDIWLTSELHYYYGFVLYCDSSGVLVPYVCFPVDISVNVTIIGSWGNIVTKNVTIYAGWNYCDESALMFHDSGGMNTNEPISQVYINSVTPTVVGGVTINPYGSAYNPDVHVNINVGNTFSGGIFKLYAYATAYVGNTTGRIAVNATINVDIQYGYYNPNNGATGTGSGTVTITSGNDESNYIDMPGYVTSVSNMTLSLYSYGTYYYHPYF